VTFFNNGQTYHCHGTDVTRIFRLKRRSNACACFLSHLTPALLPCNSQLTETIGLVGIAQKCSEKNLQDICFNYGVRRHIEASPPRVFIEVAMPKLRLVAGIGEAAPMSLPHELLENQIAFSDIQGPPISDKLSSCSSISAWSCSTSSIITMRYGGYQWTHSIHKRFYFATPIRTGVRSRERYRPSIGSSH